MFSVDALSGNVPAHVYFSKPVTITFSFQLPAGTVASSVYSQKVYYYNQATLQWQEAGLSAGDPGGSVTISGNTVTVTIATTHLTTFALLSDTTAPYIASLSPGSGYPGTGITITGTQFGTSGNVTFTPKGGGSALPEGYSSSNGTLISTQVPSTLTAGSYNVTVTTGGLTSNAMAFTVPTGGGTGGGGGGGFFTTTSTSTPGTAVVSSIGTTAVTTSDGNVTLSIPQGALPSGTTVQVATLPTSEVTAPPASEVFAGDVIQISDGGVGLSSPVPATFKYNASALNGLNPLRLAVFYWNPTANAWQYVGGAVDTSTGTITATLHHFSTYAVMANTQTFSDIPSGFWGRNDIDALLGAQIINGFPNGTFQPNGTVTRAQFAKMLVMALGLTPATTNSPFTDVSSSAWYAPYVDAAAQAGVVNGVGNGLFDPNATISRQEMVTMIARAIGGTASSSRLSAFTDSGSIASWAQGAVSLALKDNLVKGMTSTTFDPIGTSTRAQAAAVIARTLRFNGTM